MSSRQKTWHFRVASAIRAGGGHVSRGLAVAEAVRSAFGSSAKICFVLDTDHHRDWTRIISSAGFETAKGVGKGGCDYLFLDHYHCSGEELKSLRQESGFMALIHDFGDMAIEADLIVHPHLTDYKGRVGHGQVLCGLRYAPIQSFWRNVMPGKPPDRASRLLIGFGQIDSLDCTGLIWRALQSLGDARPSYDIAVGPNAVHLDSYRAMASNDPKATLHVGASNLAELVGQSDLIIGAAGVSLLERLVTGRPTATLAQTPEQAEMATILGNHDATYVLGMKSKATVDGIAAKIADLLHDVELRSLLATAGPKLVDGLGAVRIVESIREMDRHSA